MNDVLPLIAFVFTALTLPFLTAGVVGKTKAMFQGRIGAPIWQTVWNVLKLACKSEVLSEDASLIFRLSPVVVLATMLVLTPLLPWVSFAPQFPGRDLFLIVYLFALARFFTVIASLDAGSPFGGFSASRECTLSMLTEPAIVLSFVALGLSARTTDLSAVFSLSTFPSPSEMPLWLLCGMGLFLAALVELSRMPVDDPTTHLELTMIHEAMVIENSGPNLALLQVAYWLRLTLLFGIIGQCFLHALICLAPIDSLSAAIFSVAAVPFLGFLTAVIESLAVRLPWKKNPEYIAYSLTMSLLASLAAIVKGVGL